MKKINVVPGVLDEVIPQNELAVGAWYVGTGRFIGALGLWDGKVFHGFQHKFGQYLDTTAEYGARGFDPVTLIIGE